MNDSNKKILQQLAGGLIVSCQAYPGEPMRDPKTMGQVAASAVIGGAVAIRVQGIEDILEVTGKAQGSALSVPVIGLWKDGESDVFITPTLEHAKAVAAAGAHIVALDGTRRERPDGLSLREIIAGLKAEFDVLVMADCACLEDALHAQEAGADILGTTLSGYTSDRPKTTGPDFELISEIVAACSLPVVAEGRIRSPEDVVEALARRAMAVCVGTAITHPTSITRNFVAAIKDSASSTSTTGGN